ncbi:rhodanese-like domain-containing protein [Jannaschia sp. W003]|uniref:rhodanese-like domain-containing protein n=1 Tax=Jannaschia sp. W003 TaxID=2867012 RepID=UPI0021A93069|nr:rhodanese-like domain-containing protein [Jannaschia sp. W003]UWQ22436.1 rhodanese-like domain-containing protein [Jannaschia sp. W003]
MPMSMKYLVAEAKAQVGSVSPQEAQDAGGLILDVRESGELEEKGRVEGALHVPRGVLESRADPDLPTAERRLVDARAVHVLCASGARAAMAAAQLRRMGYEADVIEGGLEGWRKAGLPVEG